MFQTTNLFDHLCELLLFVLSQLLVVLDGGDVQLVLGLGLGWFKWAGEDCQLDVFELERRVLRVFRLRQSEYDFLHSLLTAHLYGTPSTASSTSSILSYCASQRGTFQHFLNHDLCHKRRVDRINNTNFQPLTLLVTACLPTHLFGHLRVREVFVDDDAFDEHRVLQLSADFALDLDQFEVDVFSVHVSDGQDGVDGDHRHLVVTSVNNTGMRYSYSKL